MSKVRILQDQDCTALIDQRFERVVIVSFCGAVSEKLLREFVAWYRGHILSCRAGAEFVMINDPSRVSRHLPGNRKVAADELKKLGPLMERYSLENILIVDNALLRGALTALGWLTGTKKVGTPVKDMPEAIATALRALTRVGLPVPAGLDASYQAPLSELKKAG